MIKNCSSRIARQFERLKGYEFALLQEIGWTGKYVLSCLVFGWLIDQIEWNWQKKRSYKGTWMKQSPKNYNYPIEKNEY